jgi:hypothetical protein
VRVNSCAPVFFCPFFCTPTFLPFGLHSLFSSLVPVEHRNDHHGSLSTSLLLLGPSAAPAGYPNMLWTLPCNLYDNKLGAKSAAVIGEALTHNKTRLTELKWVRSFPPSDSSLSVTFPLLLSVVPTFSLFRCAALGETTLEMRARL